MRPGFGRHFAALIWMVFFGRQRLPLLGNTQRARMRFAPYVCCHSLGQQWRTPYLVGIRCTALA